MKTEIDTQNIFISTNGYKDLYDFKRGILPENDEYRMKEKQIIVDDEKREN